MCGKFFNIGNHQIPGTHWSLAAYPTPMLGVPDFFHQNDREGCLVDLYNGLGHFYFGFWVTGCYPLRDPSWLDEG